MKPDDLIADLQSQLTPVRRVAPTGRTIWLWLLLSGVYVALSGSLMGPFRPGFSEELVLHSRFAAEMLMGLGAVVCFAVAALGTSVPGFDTRWFRRAGWLLVVGWLSQFVLGLAYPVLEPTMLGKRDHCVWEAYIYSVPPLLGMIWLQHRRYVLRPLAGVGYAALAAGILPALMMQLACMYEPLHALQFHVVPALLLTAAGILVVWGRQRLSKSRV